MKAYHFLPEDMTEKEVSVLSRRSTEPPWKVGEERTFQGAIELGRSGYHCSPTLWDALSYAGGPIACLVEIDAPWGSQDLGSWGGGGRWSVSRTRKLLRAVDVERELRLFAADCAERVLQAFERDNPDDDRPRKAIRAARDFANGRVTWEVLTAAGKAADEAAHRAVAIAVETAARDAAADAASPEAWEAARKAAAALATRVHYNAAAAATWITSSYAAKEAVKCAVWTAAQDAKRLVALKAAKEAARLAARFTARLAARFTAQKAAPSRTGFDYVWNPTQEEIDAWSGAWDAENKWQREHFNQLVGGRLLAY